MKSIDLSIDYSKEITPVTDSRHYPQVNLDNMDGSKLPDEGQITFTFKKKRMSEDMMDDGEKRCCCCLELTSITDVVDEEVKSPTSNRQKEAGDALDALRNSANDDEEGD